MVTLRYFLHVQIGNCPLHEAVSTNRVHNGTVAALLAAPGGSSVVNTANQVSDRVILSSLVATDDWCNSGVVGLFHR